MDMPMSQVEDQGSISRSAAWTRTVSASRALRGTLSSTTRSTRRPPSRLWTSAEAPRVVVPSRVRPSRSTSVARALCIGSGEATTCSATSTASFCERVARSGTQGGRRSSGGIPTNMMGRRRLAPQRMPSWRRSACSRELVPVPTTRSIGRVSSGHLPPRRPAQPGCSPSRQVWTSWPRSRKLDATFRDDSVVSSVIRICIRTVLSFSAVPWGSRCEG